LETAHSVDSKGNLFPDDEVVIYIYIKGTEYENG
jgi:hypothetical protein